MSFAPAIKSHKNLGALVPAGTSPGANKDDTLGLSFYKDVPNVEMHIREFEEMTIERLKLLHAFDRKCGYDTHLDKIHEKRGEVSKELGDAQLNLPRDLAGKSDFMRRDTTSHYALRIAFCKTRDAREWFVRQEQRLFVLRYAELPPEAQNKFLQIAGVTCKKFAGSKEDLSRLQAMTPAAKIWDGGAKPTFDENFYEMPFNEVHPQLIAKRQVVLKMGIAYVPSSSLKLILAQKYKEYLNSALEVAFTNLPAALADARVGGFLRLLQDHGLQLIMAPKNPGAEDAGEKLDLQNFSSLLVRSFPPCMRRMIDKQRETKQRLKHCGKLQLRPFLKDCGFSLEESVRWWQTEFMNDREVTATVFEKNYVYDIEHTYGKKGNFQGQNGFGCAKIIGFPGEAAGQAHGCPFKQLDMPALKHMLFKWQVPASNMNEIEKLVGNGKHFQLACVEYFKSKHPKHEGDGVGNSPIEFYRQSCSCFAKKDDSKDKEANKAAPAPIADGVSAGGGGSSRSD